QTYPLPNNKIRALWFDNQFNRLFISTYREKLIYLDKKTNALKNIDSPLLNNMHQSTIENMIPYQEDMLVLLSQDGLLKMNRQTLAIDYLLDDSLLRQKCTGNIRSIYIDDKNRLWVSSLEEGLILIDLNTQKLLHRYGNGLQKDSKIPSAINAICGNSKNGLFMSTLNSGILQYNNEKNTFESYAKEKHLLMSNICYNIVMSNFGNLIVTTDKGVSIIDVSVNKKAASAYHIHLNDLHQISGLGTDCGIYVSPYNNRIYVGALYGLFSFNEHDINQQTDNYSLLFSTLTVNNQTISPNTSELLSKEISFTKQITLPYNQNTLSLTFTTTNYVLSNYTTYEYKMEGLDKIWISAKDKTITYSSLRPGTYKLTVREVENPQKATTLEIHIQPPFWFAWQAWILYGILLFFATRWLYLFNKTKTRLRTSLRTEQEKIDFLTNISNELRGPLTVIITLLNTLSAEQNTIGKGRIGKVVKQALYMQHLITQLLTFNDTEKEELSLPDEKESDENEGTAETDESTSPYTLIIIDQNEDIRNIIKETFSFAYRIVEARDGDEGYTLATTEHPDIIFCEITVPGISGIELCKMLKSNIETLSIPILLITSNPSNEQKLLCIRAGADDYIVKPFQMELLLQRSNSLIRNRRNIEGKYSAEIVEQPSDLMAKNNSEQMFLDAATRVIEKNLDNTAFDISLWSKELEVGRTTLFNQIKEITGMTPNDYILSYKMNKAKLLLHDNNNQPIAEIAYRLGYSDPAYFSRSFKKIVGVSPQLYKKSNNNFHSKEADSPTP
ncbi:MAG: response regulator, partial [Tannerellaceae bacterium]